MKESTTRYISIFVISAILLLTALSINNLFWVTGSPEWKEVHTVHNLIGHWTGPVREYDVGELFSYLIFYRIFSVWSNLRDILSAVIVGLLIMLSVMSRERIELKKINEK
ncbi:unnamed protein product [marine sediment metagenome]|uniref:Uncharacterized protein n=1 Tax=marine sediment metagenome TaxID=412755 RepID=X1MH60_9ZZZZ